MTSRELCRDDGFILVDAIIALALAAMFISILSATALAAQEMYLDASRRMEIIQAYRDHVGDIAGMMPYETRVLSYPVASSSPFIMRASARWYGDDMIETDASISEGSTTVEFAAVRSYPYGSRDEAAGTPLCSADFMSGNIVGSYGYIAGMNDVRAPHVTAVSLPVNASLPITDLAVRDGVAYLSADSVSAADPDLIIADISDPSHPHMLSMLNTGPGLSVLSIAGRYVFAAADSAAAQLHVIRLDSLSAPSLVATYQLPLPLASTSPPAGTAIAYDHGRVYLGTTKWDGQEFAVIDASVPEAPAMIGGLDIDSQVDSIYAHEGLAYVSSSGQDALSATDVSDPAHPHAFASFSPPDWQRQGGGNVSYFEDSLAFARPSGGFNIASDKEIFGWDAASGTPSRYGPARPADIKSAASIHGQDIPGGVYGVVTDRRHIFLATRTAGKEFTIFDRSLATSSEAHYPLPAPPQAMVCDGDTIYILAKTAPIIYEISF